MAEPVRKSFKRSGNTVAGLQVTNMAERAPQPLPSQTTPTLTPLLGVGNQVVQSLLQAKTIQAKLTVSQPGDPYEQEADQVAEQVMRMPVPAQTARTSLTQSGQVELVQRKCATCEEEEEQIQAKEIAGRTPRIDAGGEAQIKTQLEGGQPLPGAVRAFFEPRFGSDLSEVRVHTDAPAAELARSIQARAFTLGQSISFGAGQYAPNTSEGQRLLAHELAHTIQQRTGRMAQRTIQRRWDAATTECSAQPQDKWINKVVVNQEVPQTATVHWSDGTTEVDECSTGKGHCCVTPEMSGGTCSATGSRADGSNCTPVTRGAGLPVVNRVLDHSGVPFWSEFEPNRAIALHQYSPVDGTPLSHGCVRLNQAMAEKIFCGVRRNRTLVQVTGLARPQCEHTALRLEWKNDFQTGGLDLVKFDGDRNAQASIREARRMLNASFGRRLTVAEINALTEDDIPHCLLPTTEEARRTDTSLDDTP